MKQLYRSKTNKTFAGVCGGIGEYFDVDPVLIRVGWILVSVVTGVIPGILAYIIVMFIIPEERSIVREGEVKEK